MQHTCVLLFQDIELGSSPLRPAKINWGDLRVALTKDFGLTPNKLFLLQNHLNLETADVMENTIGIRQYMRTVMRNIDVNSPISEQNVKNINLPFSNDNAPPTLITFVVEIPQNNMADWISKGVPTALKSINDEGLIPDETKKIIEKGTGCIYKKTVFVV